jgi:CDGSH-type Zn-finger protein
MIIASRNGPLYVHGNVTILNSKGEVILQDTRVALCRCGASKNKPFCDNSHLDIGFSEPGGVRGNTKPTLETHTPLTIQPTLDGPYLLRGDFEIFSADGQTVYRGKSILLCRCGGSKNKPFCDDTHLEIGFKSEV